MRLTKFESVDEILDELVPVFRNHNGLVPMDWTPARKVVMFSLAEDFAGRLTKLTTLLSEKAIKEVYVSPSHFIKTAHKLQIASKRLNFEKEKVVSTYLSMCNSAVIGWKDEAEKINKKCNEIAYIEGGLEFQRKIAYFNSLVRAFSEAVYCDDHTIGGDICGPFSLADGILLVREYKRLRPLELFDVLDQFDISGVISYCVYANNDIKIDLIGNITQCNDMISTLKKCYVEVIDKAGKQFVISTEQQLQDMIDYMEFWLKRVISYYRRLDEREKNELLFKCEFYAFKPLFDYFGMPWKPQTFELKDLTKDKHKGISLREQLQSLTDETQIIQCVKRILDPRE